MPNLTIDHNILIALETKDDQGGYAFADNIRRLANEGRVTVSIPAIMASENPKKGTKAISNFSEFKARLGSLGLEDCQIIAPMFYWGVGFWGSATWATAEMKELEEGIHGVLVPSGIPLENPGNAQDKKWRNWKCDVQTVWAHAWHKTDCLVTRDERMIRRASRLETYGAKVIGVPEAELMLGKLSAS